MNKVAIVGFGNSLQGDDGVGSYVVTKLKARQLPPNIELVDGGLNAMAILASYRDAAELIIIDAIFGSGQPGDVYCLSLADLAVDRRQPVFSLHDLTPVDAVLWAQATGPLPPVTIYGVHPQSLDYRQELSPIVRAAAERLTDSLCVTLNSEYLNRGGRKEVQHAD